MTSRIGVATAAEVPDLDDEGQRFLAALRDRDVTAEPAVWDAELDWSAYDLVVVRSTWDYAERLPEFLAWADLVSESTPLLNSAAVLRWNTDKRYLAELEAGRHPDRADPVPRAGRRTAAPVRGRRARGQAGGVRRLAGHAATRAGRGRPVARARRGAARRRSRGDGAAVPPRGRRARRDRAALHRRPVLARDAEGPAADARDGAHRGALPAGGDVAPGRVDGRARARRRRPRGDAGRAAARPPLRPGRPAAEPGRAAAAGARAGRAVAVPGPPRAGGRCPRGRGRPPARPRSAELSGRLDRPAPDPDLVAVRVAVRRLAHAVPPSPPYIRRPAGRTSAHASAAGRRAPAASRGAAPRRATRPRRGTAPRGERCSSAAPPACRRTARRTRAPA